MIPVSQPSLGALERKLVNECLDNNQLTYGPMVQRFERELAEFLGVRHALAVTSGTTALHLALVALGIGPHDEVLVPDLTFVATANAVFYTGAKVVLVDVDPKTWCLDLADAANKVTRRTRAIVPVHLYGVPCDMDGMRSLAEIHRLFVVEDAAEGLGGSYGTRMLGTFGNAGVFSFYGNKVLTTGEGGAIITDSSDLHKKAFALRGQAMDPERRYYHREIGFNYRMTDLQAAVGIGQLARLDATLRRRADICRLYRERLTEFGYVPLVQPGTTHAPWLFTFELPATADRDEVARALAAAGVETRPAFVPMHQLPMYRQPHGDFPVAGRIGNRALSLPTYPDLSFQDVDRICDVVIKTLTRREEPCTTR